MAVNYKNTSEIKAQLKRIAELEGDDKIGMQSMMKSLESMGYRFHVSIEYFPKLDSREMTKCSFQHK